AALPIENIQSLQTQSDTLKIQLAKWTETYNQLTENLTTEQNKNLTQLPLQHHLQIQNEQTKNINEINQKIGSHTQQLENAKKLKDQHAALELALKKQQKEFSRWERLNALIGSADGKKFRLFVQGITFDIMIQHANEQLQKLTDRYQLLRRTFDEKVNKNSPNEKISSLELDVIDTYQADEVRTIKNLSGGETFLISLALALGLAQMASKKVRIDSLFLDEGFGTLDEDTLDSALQTLSTLQENGKLIGIISHVAQLKERLTTQINISPNNNGKSIITGPNVVKL
ncbi:MAG: SbcC/MukB-like Walker B domain-containing protein, partial [Lentisphaeria bacterium]